MPFGSLRVSRPLRGGHRPSPIPTPSPTPSPGRSPQRPSRWRSAGPPIARRRVGAAGVAIVLSTGNTFLLVATATNPEGPYTKIPNILHRGHEAMVWKDEDAVGSMGLAFGPKCYFTSRNGIDFSAVHRLKPLKAAGVYRADFEEGSKGARPTWGIAMGKNKGLCRFEIIWPQP